MDQKEEDPASVSNSADKSDVLAENLPKVDDKPSSTEEKSPENVEVNKNDRLSALNVDQVDEAQRKSPERLCNYVVEPISTPESKAEEMICPESSLIEFKGGGEINSSKNNAEDLKVEGEDRLPHSTTSLRGSESPIPVGNLPPPRPRRPQLLDNLKKKTTSESSEPESFEEDDSPPPSVNPVNEDPDLASTYINKRSSLYVKNPDFTKRMQQSAPQTSTSSQVASVKSSVSNDLSPLRMKPPDFSKIAQADNLPPPPANVTPSNFEEISRKYNYISDLQLKPQPVLPPQASPNYKNLYVSAPNFTSHKFHGDVPGARAVEVREELEEPTAHIIPKKQVQYSSNSQESLMARYQESMARSYAKQQYLPDQRMFAPQYGYSTSPGAMERVRKVEMKPQTPPKVSSYEPKSSVIQHQQQIPVDLYGNQRYMPPSQHMARSPVMVKHPPSPSSMNPPQNWPGRVTPQSPHNGSTGSPNFLQPAPVAYKSSSSPQGTSYFPPNGEMKSPYSPYYAAKTVAKDKPPIDYVDLTKPQKTDLEPYRGHQDLRRSESLGRSTQPREPTYDIRHSSSESNLQAYYRQRGESSSKQSIPTYRYPPQSKDATLPKPYPHSPSQDPTYERTPSVIERLPSATASTVECNVSPVTKVKSEPSSKPTTATSTNSVFTQVKRESPLDLSVKTVKTKADSTGCDDVGSSSKASSSLKVNYVPNFSKHTQEAMEYRQMYGQQVYEPSRPQPIPPNLGQVVAKRVAVPEQQRSGYPKTSTAYYPSTMVNHRADVVPQRTEYSPTAAGLYYDAKRAGYLLKDSNPRSDRAHVHYSSRESVVQPPNATNVIKSVRQEAYQQYPTYPPKTSSTPQRYENHQNYQKYPQAIPQPAEYPQQHHHQQIPQQPAYPKPSHMVETKVRPHEHYQYNYPKVTSEKEERKRPSAESYPFEMVPPKKSPKVDTPIQQKVDAYLNSAGYYKSHHYLHPVTPPQHPSTHHPQPQHQQHPHAPTHHHVPPNLPQRHPMQHLTQQHHPAASLQPPQQPPHHLPPPSPLHLQTHQPHSMQHPPAREAIVHRPVVQSPFHHHQHQNQNRLATEYPYAPKEMKSVQTEKTAEPASVVYYPPTPKKDYPATESSALRYSVQQSYRAATPYDHHSQRMPPYVGSQPPQHHQPHSHPQYIHEAMEKHPVEFKPHPPSVPSYAPGGTPQTVTARQWYPSLPPPQQNHHQQYPPPGQVFHQRPPDNIPATPTSNLIRTQSEERLVPNSGKLGADRDVLSKLKNTIEGKQKLLVRKQNSAELSEEDSSKADIASILAARIRTKGELKGFTPIPVTSVEGKDAPASVEEEPPIPVVVGPIDPPSDLEGASAFDLLDFGSACNDFVEQLQTGRKKMKRRRSRKSEVGEVSLEIVKQEVSDADVDIPPESVVPPEAILKAAESLTPVKVPKSPSASSSDEDKPLFLLRQQSEEVKTKTNLKKTSSSSENESEIPLKRSELFERLADKISKNIREKQEKRLAARLNSSTSEDDEASKSSQKRKRKPLRKTKNRSARDSDDTSDDEKKKVKKSSSESEMTKKKVKTDSGRKKSTKKVESSSEEEKSKGKTVKGKKLTGKKTSSSGSSDSGEEGDSEEKSVSTRSKNATAAKSFDVGKEKASPAGKTKLTRRSKDVGSGGEDSEKNTMSMTRSKKRKELEKQLANSKVLRNDKIVQNVTVDKKKKPKMSPLKVDDAKRKILDTDSDDDGKSGKGKKKPRRISKLQSSSSSESSESESEAETVSERLRPRKPQQKPPVVTPPKNGKVSGGGKCDTTPGKKNNIAKVATATEAADTDPGDNKFPPGWELQLYEYKRSLKIPPSLITIARPSWHRISTSLPDLDPHSSDASESYRPDQARKSQSMKKKADPIPQDETSKSSIIDVLHQRVTQKSRQITQKKTPKPQAKATANIATLKNTTAAQLLPTPGVDENDRSIFGPEGKKYGGSGVKSRTRTEYRIMKTKEIIRQVFGGEDRPASAPPFRGGVDDSGGSIKREEAEEETPKAVTFDQKFQEYIRQMSIDVGFTSRSIKTEKIFVDDGETQDTMLESQSVISERDGLTPISFNNVIRRSGKKGNRNVRRKGSSGFDYIRKKKKPLTESQQAALAKKRQAAAMEIRERDEQDIGREVKGWVLNKGVGESVLHKAARLNYLDVIAYCLDRMEMYPDQKDNAGYTPLHEACSRGHLEIARLLLQYGANHSETALSGIRPLHDAVENGYVEVARLLLSYGADPLLATYAGQTPLALAEDDDMAHLLKSHLHDVQNTGPDKKPWKFAGSWETYDPDEFGYNVLEDIPGGEEEECMTNEVKESSEKCDSNSNIMKRGPEPLANCRANGSSLPLVDPPLADPSEGDLFEMEESEMPLPPLYLLRDEGAEKWVLLNDLCNLLKVKSRDTLLKQIQPGGLAGGASHKELIRELKTGDFLQKATCLQLLCAGEKLNIRSSKVVLIKYNVQVQALLGVQTMRL
ncbi:hypothetical protein DMENIID0001_045120 [Sergentomyia squamirostris]